MVVPESSINNIMGGLESTGGVRLHNHKRRLKQRFDIVKKLGQGTYGKVQLGINKETGQEVAIKTIKKCKIETEADLIRIRREIQIMSSVQHPNIIHIYEVFENREKMVLVMEYAAGGELYDFLSERKVLAEEEARRIFRQIATAVYYCHKHKICHRDLKLENILLDENGNAKIADFGLSNVFDESHLLGTFCGSPLYASPEIVKGTPYHGPEVDCWSLGVLLYTLVYGAMPFDGSNFKRLVRQISQGDYFEPKKPSPASPLIRDMLNVNPARRADINAICSHWWIDAGQSVPCLEEAEELANQTPVRLDLLLCLAPSGDNDKLLVADQPPIAEGGDRPLRSQSLSSLATPAQAEFLVEPTPKRDIENRAKRKEEGGSVKRKERSRSRRERSSSRSRREDSTPEHDPVTEKPKRRSLKTKKNSNEKLVIDEPKEKELQPQISEVEEEMAKASATVSSPEPKSDQVPKEKSPVPSDEVVIEELKQEELTERTTPIVEAPKQASPVPSIPQTPTAQLAQTAPTMTEKTEEKAVDGEKPAKPMERRKSKIFETAEKFNKISATDTQPKPQPKKITIPGVKVSDAKKAYERRSSLASSTNFIRSSASRKSITGESPVSPPPVEDAKFSLASSVALNKLVENVERLSKMEDEKEENGKIENKCEELKTGEPFTKSSPEKIIEVRKEKPKAEEVIQSEEEARKKVRNAVQVIGHAISEGDTKAATLPRRRTSRAEIKLAMPASKPPEFRSEVEHMVGTPASMQRSEVKFPVAAPPVTRPTTRQGSAPREYIVPIQFEQEPVAKPPPPVSVQRPVTRTSSRSLSRQSTQDSDFSSSASIGEPIRKSPREVIIPIAVEGGGFVTPSADAISRMGSLNESEDDLPRGFGLHSTRRHNRQLDAADSVSSDEDDDNFEILTAENLFSTLLSRVRSLTQRLNTEDRQTAFPRLFNQHPSIFDFPPRRLAEARSFGRADSVPWRRSMSRESSTLPRDGSNSRVGMPLRNGSLKSSRSRPPKYQASGPSSSVESSYHLPSNNSDNVFEYNNCNPKITPLESVVEMSDLNQQKLNVESESETMNKKTSRGVPTVEIVGSSEEPKKAVHKKSSKLPQLKSKAIKEPKVNEEEIIKPLEDNATSEVSPSQSQQRKNSLERPSYYNTLHKNKVQALNDGNARSLIRRLPVNGDLSYDSSTTADNEYHKELAKPLSSSHCNSEEKEPSEYNFYAERSCGTLGRSYSLKAPSATSHKILKTQNPSMLSQEADSKYRSLVNNNDNNQVPNITRVPNLREDGRYSSKFIRPRSFYGGTDYTNYQTLPVIKSVPVVHPHNTLSVDLLSGKRSEFGRKSPIYQRSISMFEGVRSNDTSQHLDVTPDQSVLGKFLSERKSDITCRINSSSGENQEKTKSRRMSRFLRPDFYDTPKEDSLYEKKVKSSSNLSNEMWKEKDRTPIPQNKKSSIGSKEVLRNQNSKLSIIDKAIKSLKQNVNNLGRESMERESNLIKRAVSLEDCSLTPEIRGRRSTSVTPQTNYEKRGSMYKTERIFQKKKVEDLKKSIEHKLENKCSQHYVQSNTHQDSFVKVLGNKLNHSSKNKTNTSNGVITGLENKRTLGNNILHRSLAVAQETNSSRLSQIAGLKPLEFNRPAPSADSTPSMEESKLSTELDDSSSFLSPTEDGSDTWSISSDYADAREFIFPSSNGGDSVSERIRRKSFYSRFNQTKRKKSSQSSQLRESRSGFPTYFKSSSSDLGNVNSLRKVSVSDPSDEYL